LCRLDLHKGKHAGAFCLQMKPADVPDFCGEGPGPGAEVAAGAMQPLRT
jgi:hypothetical protein